ncbi:hypothetical protein FN846DRAFT_902425 [Sphaerosporella brunnea]|uniref:Uncharacterized protein n=1 Tax=Sphaerosporella brunnea TaxID=1250544 RepID=A0A5J5FA96_9PEZI|nr:hypothetical protein FN846DRAFT_902425 [Sphaerosporella brunnea]
MIPHGSTITSTAPDDDEPKCNDPAYLNYWYRYTVDLTRFGGDSQRAQALILSTLRSSILMTYEDDEALEDANALWDTLGNAYKDQAAKRDPMAGMTALFETKRTNFNSQAEYQSSLLVDVAICNAAESAMDDKLLATIEWTTRGSALGHLSIRNDGYDRERRLRTCKNLATHGDMREPISPKRDPDAKDSKKRGKMSSRDNNRSALLTSKGEVDGTIFADKNARVKASSAKGEEMNRSGYADNAAGFPDEQDAFGGKDGGLMDASDDFEAPRKDAVDGDRMESDAVNNSIIAQPQHLRTDRQLCVPGDSNNDDCESNCDGISEGNRPEYTATETDKLTAGSGDKNKQQHDDADEENGRYSESFGSTVAKRNAMTIPAGALQVDMRNDESEDPDNAIGMADSGEMRHRLCSEWGSHGTCGYDTESNADHVRLGSQMDRTATEALVGDTAIGWSYLRRIPATRQGIERLEYEDLL